MVWKSHHSAFCIDVPLCREAHEMWFTENKIHVSQGFSDISNCPVTVLPMWQTKFTEHTPSPQKLPCMFYIKFYSPKPIFYLPSSTFTCIGEWGSVNFSHLLPLIRNFSRLWVYNCIKWYSAYLVCEIISFNSRAPVQCGVVHTIKPDSWHHKSPMLSL